MTHMCVNSTARGAFNLGYRPSLAAIADLFGVLVATASDVPDYRRRQFRHGSADYRASYQGYRAGEAHGGGGGNRAAMSSGASTGDEVPDGAQLNTARNRSTQYIVQHGNLYVGGAPNYLVGGFGAPGRDVAPSRLLAARYQVVDFLGRETELTELAAWRDDAGLGLAVRLVHGPGGQGKTRLAAQFAQHCAETGWTVAQTAHRSLALPLPHSTPRG